MFLKMFLDVNIDDELTICSNNLTCFSWTAIFQTAWVVEVMMRFRNMQKHSFDSSIYIIYLNDTLTFARVFSPLAVCMCIYSSICTEWNCIINMNVQNREYVKNYTLLGRRRFFCLWLSLRQEQKDFEALETDLVCQLRAETGTTEMTMMIW